MCVGVDSFYFCSSSNFSVLMLKCLIYSCCGQCLGVNIDVTLEMGKSCVCVVCLVVEETKMVILMCCEAGKIMRTYYDTNRDKTQKPETFFYFNGCIDQSKFHDISDCHDTDNRYGRRLP